MPSGSADDSGSVFENDPLGELVTHGSLPQSLEAAFEEMAGRSRSAIPAAPGLHAVRICGHVYSDAGGNAVQELAFALATGVEYLRQLEARGIGVNRAAPCFGFAFSIGADFFMAVAKFRAARMLWSRIISASGGEAQAQKMRIHARTSLWNRSALDPYVNILRGATEAFAAVAGGCDSIQVGAFDEVIRPSSDLSRRIARNTQIILREECHFDHVIDPAGGSYYVETLTSQMARKAWALFQEIEKLGGMARAIMDGFPQREVGAVAASKAESIAQRRLSLIGVNVYANPREKPLEGAVESGDCIAGTSDSAVRAVPLPPRRAAEPFEKMRAAVAAAGPPKVFLASMGPLRQHKARADFAASFFDAGGFDVIGARGFQSVEEAADAARQSDARVFVICSTDETYPEIVPALAGKIKAKHPDSVIVLAGFPKDQVEGYKAAGVDEFIHIRSNCYETLRGISRKIGVSL